MADEFDNLQRAIANGTRVISLSGLTSVAAKAFLLTRLQSATGKAFAVVTESNTELESWQADLDFFRSETEDQLSAIITLPSFESDPYSGVSPHAETQERRALALWQLRRGDHAFVVLSARSLVQRTVKPDEIAALGCVLARDVDFPPEVLIERLFAGGYVREEPLFGPGQFSVRGGIIDIWSPDSDSPVRVEFFGDTVDSLRTFDPDTQLSTGHIKEIAVAPMREMAVTTQDLKDWAFFARERFSDDRFARNLRDRTDFAVEGETFSGWEFLIPLVKPLGSTIFEHLSDCVFVIDEPSAVEHLLTGLYEHTNDNFAAITDSGEVGLDPDELFLTTEELREGLDARARLELRALGRTAAGTDEEFVVGNSTEEAPLFIFPAVKKAVEIDIISRSTRKYRGDIQAFVTDLGMNAKKGDRTEIVIQTPGMAERLEEILREYDAALTADSIRIGGLSSGFEFPGERLTVYTEGDIFGDVTQAEFRPAKEKGHRTKSKLGAFISDFRDLKQGDYVVHVDHGIGRFDGLQTISSQGAEREFMLLIYADEAKLFVPVERMDLVSRYSSGEATSPTLERLGGMGWHKTKAKAKRAMRDMADELLKLYAERKLVRGHAFPPDAPWQHEFEDAFPYDLTVDQAAAIEDVKSDMETPTPMDRLIIGDVGYGKTEVAMRAAFKAVMDGKQAAVLTPTTVLAYQHFESFKKRFAAFPIKVDLLSRFRSSKEQKAVSEAAGKGEVDVLIGTHRILSTDVQLPKLGLVVIDEEQRFGVGHKEKLKQLKKKVDVLTLSATPIPRTLNMSLLGMRDMSVIETPPRDRLAINTQVVQFAEGVIRSAIELELARNGQIFFIHNRVESIEAIAALIQKIVPNARIAIGHGQMNEKEMEEVMLDFIDYKYDILVATTIIENGIDIPRANTIIINRADNYGLSQLYQLRGRVGRSNRRAYAYLLIPSELELTPIARRRLSAIREFSDLGAGFRLAALDLELRGAGNILGGQQSGHLDALGFDLYTKMLERTIAELRGDEIADETSVSINLGVDVSIPKDYIAETSQRLRTYKRISSAESDEELTQIHVEIEDRYGRIPRSVDNLFAYGRLRKLAERMAIMSVDRTADGVAIKLGESARVSPEKLMKFLDENEGSAFSPTGILRVGVLTADPIETARLALQSIRL
ncbi:MAG: transcription-repair coupling factor [Pyrinomonadaceae bacterium]|nr:transcription-repair coupling factor [Pyrinomonadaceae bacterium]MBP6212686.1 transcription-repair coupling factor [Pyrinomonadaceae bacterium]